MGVCIDGKYIEAEIMEICKDGKYSRIKVYRRVKS